MGGDDREVKVMAEGAGCREEERILVSVRVRPLSEKEVSRNEVVDWECISDTTVVYKNQLSPERSIYPTSYTLDRVFRWDCSTRQVYEGGARAVVLSAVKGINSSVFAYGQTSSGKTFTMYGIIEYTMEDIFDYIQKHKERDFQLKFSAMEIYNESVRDLLTEDNSPLRLLDDPERGTVVEKLTEETLRDWSHFKELLAVCEAQRQSGETFLNEVSSRSHQILRLTIESSTREYLGKSNSGTLIATLNFVDLAGSERASQALSAGSRLKEGSHINRSLLTLGTVIRKLSKGRTGHIPYRDSKLTRILQSSLGGNARTAIVCTMSPARSYVEQSRNTLLFASCAKEVTTNAHVNVVMSDKALVKHLQRELARLESELRSATPSVRLDATDLLKEKESKIEQLEGHVRDLTLQLDLALSKIQDLQQGVEDSRLTLWEGEHSSYPKLHIRSASESSSSVTTVVTQFQTPQSPDRHSRVSYEENYSISDFEENLPPTSPFERMFIETPSDASPPPIFIQPRPKVVGLNCRRVMNGLGEQTNQSEVDPYMIEGNGEHSPHSYEIDPYHASEEIGEQTSDTFEIHLPQVSNGHEAQSPYFVEFDPYHVSDEIVEQIPNNYETDQYRVSWGIPEETQKYGSTDSQQTHEAIREQADDHLEDYCKEVQCIESEITNNVQISSLPQEDGDSLLLTEHENNGCTDEEPKQETEMNNINPSSHEDLPEPFVGQQVDTVPELEDLNCLKSTSSRSNGMGSTCLSVVEKVKCEMKNECGDECDESVANTLKDIQVKLSALKRNAAENEVSHISEEVKLDGTPMTDIKVLSDIDCAGNSTCAMERKEITDSQCMEQLLDHQSEDTVHETGKFIKRKKNVGLNPQDDLVASALMHETNKSIKSMKDVGLNPQDDLDSTVLWPSEFKRLQMEIHNLWHTCNVSLVHRTHFFLLFVKAEPADTIYMEVERRRLSYIKDAFSKGSPIVLEGQKLTPNSSGKSLLREREMLGRRMKKRFSSRERNNLFVKWGIDLNSKNRCSQLSNRLWTDTIDTNHITESVNIVAKLVRFSEPQVPKEVFGLNLITNPTRRKSFSLLM